MMIVNGVSNTIFLIPQFLSVLTSADSGSWSCPLEENFGQTQHFFCITHIHSTLNLHIGHPSQFKITACILWGVSACQYLPLVFVHRLNFSQGLQSSTGSHQQMSAKHIQIYFSFHLVHVALAYRLRIFVHNLLVESLIQSVFTIKEESNSHFNSQKGYVLK